jgi:hypothetical protein
VPGTNELRAVDPESDASLQCGGYRPGHDNQLALAQGYAAGEGTGGVVRHHVHLLTVRPARQREDAPRHPDVPEFPLRKTKPLGGWAS